MVNPFDFEKLDKDYVDTMLDPAKRTTAITQLKKLRMLFLGLTVTMMPLYIIAIVITGGEGGGTILAFIMPVIVFFYMDSQVKLAKTLEKMGATAARHSGPPMPDGEDAA